MKNNNEFQIVCDPRGVITYVDNEIYLQNTSNHEIVAANYDEVAHLFGLPERHIDVLAATSRSEIYKWTDEQTHFMLNLCKENQAKIDPLKKFSNKKEMWLSLAQKCSQEFQFALTGEQVQGRFKTVMEKKAVLTNNRTSGEVRKKIPFESAMDPITQNDSILPDVREVFVGPNKMLRKENIVHTLENRPSPQCSPSISSAVNATDECFSSSPGPDAATNKEQISTNNNLLEKK